MTDLRIRIATAIMQTCHGVYMDDAVNAADVLISELNLTREYSIAENDGSRVLWLDGEDPITPREGETVETRWITEWTTNE